MTSEMKEQKEQCLNCKFYRLENISSGVCRVDKDIDKNYPQMQNDDCCPRWKNCGQQYYIRIGWIKGQSAEQSPA